MGKVFAVLALVVASAAAFTTNLNIKTCDKQGCKPAQKRVALDANSNGTEGLITVGGSAKDELTLKYGGPGLGGPRVYLIEADGKNKNSLFMLKNQEFSFTVELSTLGCGFNAALYFVGMDTNQGGAENGTHYCDAQAVGGTFCSEMDLFEANTKAQQYTTHACVDACGSYTTDAQECKGNGDPVCDQSGCGLNPFRYGPGSTYNSEYSNPGWYGDSRDGGTYQLDSSEAFTVVTQFYADPNSGQLFRISRFYLQKGNRVELPTLYVKPPSDGSHYGAYTKPSITQEYCTDIYDRWDSNNSQPLNQMGKNMDKGMVLAMSAWYAQETYVGGKPVGTQTGMSWLDGLNEWGGRGVKAGPCAVSTNDSGGPFHATFSDIRIGDIGTTMPH